MPEEDKKTTEELIESLRILRADMAARRTQLHTANNELFKTVGELSLEQFRLRTATDLLTERMVAIEEKLDAGLSAIVEQAKDNGTKAQAAVVVTEKTSGKASQAILENRIGVAVLGVIGLILQYIMNHH